MMYTKERVRSALIELASGLNRPHYEPLTVREVLESFDNNTPHPLKESVIRKLGLVELVDVEPRKVITKLKKTKVSSREAKRAILELAQHGTITKFKSGCCCKECMEWA